MTFTDWHGQEIGDHPQDVEPSGNDDNFVVNLILDLIPGVDPTPDENADSQEWTRILMPSPQEYR